MMKIKKGDLVEVVSGADRGKRGRVIAVSPSKSGVRVDGVRMQKHHLKPGRSGAQQGGIIEREGFINASNVMLVDPSDEKRSRVRAEMRGGERIRVFARSGEPVPDPIAD